MLEKIEKEVGERLRKQAVSSRVLLDRLRLLDDMSRKTSQYQDPSYLPFYYHLSKSLSPKSVLHVGLELGLPICCFLTGCSSVSRLLAFQKRDSSFYSPKIALSNIKDTRPKNLETHVHIGSISDESFEAKMSAGLDLVLVTPRMNGDELNDVLYSCWRHMNLGSFLVVDHLGEKSKQADVFNSFCRANSRPSVRFGTRYGVAMTGK